MMKKLLLSISFFASFLVYGQLTEKPLGSTNSRNGYIEYLPSGYQSNSSEKLPVIIFFHGSGENGNGKSDLYKIYTTGLPEIIKNKSWTYKNQFVVLMPQHTQTSQYNSCPSANEVRDFIDFVRNKYNIDKSRVYLTGLSCGANGIWRYIGENPTNQKVAAAVIISGNGKSASDQAKCNKTLPTWAFHGASDNISPAKNDIAANNAFNACPSPHAEAKFTLYQGVGHNAWSQTYDLSARHDIYAWFLNRRSPGSTNHAPTNISLSSTEVNENQPVGTVVGTFSTSDPDQNNTFTYTLELAGTNNDKNSFSIDGNKLKTKAVFNYASKSNYRIKVRSTDQGGLYDEKWFDYIKVTKSGGSGGIVSGQVYKLVARHSGKVLDVSECSSSDGANVQQWPWNGANCQKWKVEATNNGYYKLTSRQSGKALDVNGCSNSNGANVQQWPYWGGDCQQWKIEPTDNGYFRLLARNSGKALDVSGCSGSDGANVQIWPYNGGGCQQWKLEAVASGKSTELSDKIEQESETSMVVYNGSSEGIINLQLNLPALGNYNLRIYSLLGGVVYSETLNVNENKFIKELDLTQFQKGIYILKFEYGNQIMTKKIIL